MDIMEASGRVNLESPVSGGEAIDISGGNHSTTKPTRALWVGTGGNVKVRMLSGTALTFTNVQDGTLLPIRIDTVYQTDTTASNMTAVW